MEGSALDDKCGDRITYCHRQVNWIHRIHGMLEMADELFIDFLHKVFTQMVTNV